MVFQHVDAFASQPTCYLTLVVEVAAELHRTIIHNLNSHRAVLCSRLVDRLFVQLNRLNCAQSQVLLVRHAKRSANS